MIMSSTQHLGLQATMQVTRRQQDDALASTQAKTYTHSAIMLLCELAWAILLWFVSMLTWSSDAPVTDNCRVTLQRAAQTIECIIDKAQ